MTSLTISPGDVLLGGQAAAHIRRVPPSRTNSWADVSELARSLDLPLDDWQEDVLRAGLGERPDGSWAARTVGLSTPRQNGKSYLIVVRALAGILLFGEELIICSAHQQDTSREVFNKLCDILQEHPYLDERVEQYGRALNREYIKFKSGQVIRFKARSAGGGRGFSADCLLLDEAQILTVAAWSAILPTLSARPNPQVWLLGTPPTEPDDSGEVFSRVRKTTGTDTRTAYLEWSADPADDFDAVETWAKANPALGTRISPESVQAEREVMTDEQFAVERLGIWMADSEASVIPAESWQRASDALSMAVDRLALGIEVAPNLARATVAVAGQRADGAWHIEVDEMREGYDWVVPYVQMLLERNPGIRAVAYDMGSPSKVLGPMFETAHVRTMSPRVVELGTACSTLLAGIVTDAVHHTHQGALNAAARAAGKRRLGDTGLWVWSRSTARVDITPLQAATLALWAAQIDRVVGRPARNHQTERRAIIL